MQAPVRLATTYALLSPGRAQETLDGPESRGQEISIALVRTPP